MAKCELHPAYGVISFRCSCGNVLKTRSTLNAQETGDADMQIEVCSKCHPFYTGGHKLIDTAGRIDRFEKKYKHTTASKSVDTK